MIHVHLLRIGHGFNIVSSKHHVMFSFRETLAVNSHCTFKRLQTRFIGVKNQNQSVYGWHTLKYWLYFMTKLICG